jgi:predicted amino acid-binding ACT domain protein
MQPLQGRLTGMLGVVLAVTLAAANLRVEILDRWSVLLIGLFGMTLLLQPFF